MRYVDYQKAIDCNAPTLNAALDSLCSEYPGLRPVLFSADGQVSAVHRLFLNGDQVANTDLGNPVHEGDTLEVITAIAGGNR
ncbi:MoaD/ThiS family protein [Streptomyces sp. NRRL B-1347]|uniref:MoaD/ThiS family protein n=1 Tax=Streptomyces sp. NRRL B-1347 TaxID=1476877 RepID=UPI00068F8E6A|nr:MoaD/ThiS family protein [Streptomyces sp. NRRL B-1347]